MSLAKPRALIYIHGFNSSGLSQKGQQLASWCKLHRPDITVLTPTLAPYPLAAAQQLTALVAQYQKTHRLGVVGSSLGGYFATWLNFSYSLPAVLVNPAVAPYLLLKDHLGAQQNPYTGERYLLEEAHMAQLQQFEVEQICDPHSLWLLQQQGDEVLDHRQAVVKYRDCKQTIEAGGCHAFSGFERFCAPIITFLGL
ncbi:MAG: esterase YqiA [Enterovibrio sp.]